eukprot:7459685-Alexandrium_andersonii.AAC.1
MLSHSNLGVAKQHPRLLSQSALAHSSAPVERRPREGSQAPAWRGGSFLIVGRLGCKQDARPCLLRSISCRVLP